MLNRWYSVLAAAMATASFAPNASATITGGAVTGGTALGQGGTFIGLTVPFNPPSGPANTVGNDTFQTPHLYGFNEDQNVFIGPGPLAVDYLPGGGSGFLPAGLEVASHYIFFDPRQTTSQRGYVDFDADIVAIISETGTLLASDYLANTGVTYLNPAARGLEVGDTAIIDPILANRLLVDWAASTPGDYVRVLTKHSPGAVPEGGATILLLGFSAGFLGIVRKFLAA
jgi:hypothetical protein